MITVRPARPTDVQKFCKYIAPQWFIGVVAENEEQEVIGAGWIVWGDKDRAWLCFEGDDEIRAYKAHIARWSRRLVFAAQCVLDEIYTIEDPEDLRGSRWIEWLGFEPTDETVKGMRVLKWQKH